MISINIPVNDFLVGVVVCCFDFLLFVLTEGVEGADCFFIELERVTRPFFTCGSLSLLSSLSSLLSLSLISIKVGSAGSRDTGRDFLFGVDFFFGEGDTDEDEEEEEEE